MVNLTFKLILIGYGLGQQAGTSEQSLHRTNNNKCIKRFETRSRY